MQPSDRRCRECGTDLATASRFCSQCGSPVEEVFGIPNLSPRPDLIARADEHSTRDRRTRAAAWVAVAGVSVLALGVISRLAQSPAPYPALPAQTASTPVATGQKIRPAADVYWSDGISFRHEGEDWVRNDLPECAAPMDGGGYPEVCKLTADDADAADRWEAQHQRASGAAGPTTALRPGGTPSKLSEAIPENVFLNAYVLANKNQPDFQDFTADEIEQLGRDEYKMRLETCGPTLICMTDTFHDSAGYRALKLLDSAYRATHDGKE